jgi:hypothetical protein
MTLACCSSRGPASSSNFEGRFHHSETHGGEWRLLSVPLSFCAASCPWSPLAFPFSRNPKPMAHSYPRVLLSLWLSVSPSCSPPPCPQFKSFAQQVQEAEQSIFRGSGSAVHAPSPAATSAEAGLQDGGAGDPVFKRQLLEWRVSGCSSGLDLHLPGTEACCITGL